MKHRIQEQYLGKYIRERCKNPHQENFRLSIVDGFAGGGAYKDGSPGSPVILANTVLQTVQGINFEREVNGRSKVNVECLMFLNDADGDAIDLLKNSMAPCVAESKESDSLVKLIPEYSIGKFESKIDMFIEKITDAKCRSVLYYLDQYGYSQVNVPTIFKLMHSAKSVEVFLTYAIDALLTYLQTNNRKALMTSLSHLDIQEGDILTDGEFVSKWGMLGKMERLVHKAFSDVAPYFSPFAIHNPGKWKYWLMHFVKNAQGRVVYNDVLHDTGGLQAHYGGPGLKMLSHNPNDERYSLPFTFNESARRSSREQLYEDVVRSVCDYEGEVDVSRFLLDAYKSTPAHSDDIKTALIENPELEVVTHNGGTRRTHNNIDSTDIIKLKRPMARFFYR